MAIFGEKPLEAAKSVAVKDDENGSEGDDPKPKDKEATCVVINIYCGDCKEKKEKPKG